MMSASGSLYLARERRTIKCAVKQANKPQLSVPPLEHATVDCLDVLEDTMMFFRQKAREASDEKTAKQFARYADRAFNTPALYHHFLPSTVANHAVSRLFEIATGFQKC